MSNGKAETKIKEEIEEKPFPYMSKSTIKSVIKVFPRRIAFISDTHIGSEYALCPKQWTNPKGTTILSNPGQLIFLDYFKQFTNRCDELDVDTVFHLGDIMHGQNHKELGADLMTTDMNVQKLMSKEVLSPIFKGRKGGFVGGSGYHQGAGKANSPEQDLFEMIRLDGSPEVRWFGPVANVKIDPFDKMWHIQHGESAAIIYQATVLERDQNFMKIIHMIIIPDRRVNLNF